MKKLRFIDLFAGIGGFHLALHDLGLDCVFASEWDEFARKTYEHNLRPISPDLFDNGNFAADINDVDIHKIPNFDILCAGFPCQPFSQAGFKKGFAETRGTLFFKIAEILDKKKPSAFFLENVRHLQNHENGQTLDTIRRVVKELGYSFHTKIVKASEFGLPQHRPRLFMVGFKSSSSGFAFPAPIERKMTMSQILGGKCEKDIGYTLRVGGRGSGVGDRRNWDCYIVDGIERRISVAEGQAMQGFPSDFEFPVSTTQAMKQLGNSVAIPAVRATAEQIIRHLNEEENWQVKQQIA